MTILLILLLWIAVGWFRLFLFFRAYKRRYKRFNIDVSCFFVAAIWPFFDNKVY